MVTISMPTMALPTWRERFHAIARRSGAMAASLAALALTLMLAFALASYHPTDPSLNTAAAGPTDNLLGVPGAWAADMLLSLFGPAIVLILALPLLIATRLWRAQRSSAGAVTLRS